MPQSRRIEAPFSEAQALALDLYQHLGIFHPYTCPNHSDVPLMATENGWRCLECDYRQKWVDEESILLGAINHGHCPDCWHRGFTLGPRGGMAINIECGNKDCLNRFNVASTSISHYFVSAHRIPRASEGGANNWGYGLG